MVPYDNELRTLLLSEAHDARMGGHFGVEKDFRKGAAILDVGRAGP